MRKGHLLIASVFFGAPEGTRWALPIVRYANTRLCSPSASGVVEDNHDVVVYIIKTQFCISSATCCGISSLRNKYNLRLMICTFGDDIHAKA